MLFQYGRRPKAFYSLCQKVCGVSVSRSNLFPLPLTKSAPDDEKQDPAAGGENKQPGDLLNGDNASLTLMLGVTLTAPQAKECTEDKIYEFDVKDAMGATAQEAKFPKETCSNLDWKPSDPKEKGQFDAVVKTWRDPLLEKDAASKVLHAWSTTLGWKSSALETATPEMLLDAIDELYLEPPQISVTQTKPKHATNLRLEE